jgi:hypothetical protein
MNIPQGNDFAQVGTISINMDYLKNVPESQHGKPLTQWITLFDDLDDDEFDGDLGEDDEEHPMIHTSFTVTKVEEPAKSAVLPKKKGMEGLSSPKAGAYPSMASSNKTSPKSSQVEPLNLRKSSAAAEPRQPILQSPKNGTLQRRKTVVVTQTGAKKVVNTDDIVPL